jgi:hypothetical protein
MVAVAVCFAEEAGAPPPLPVAAEAVTPPPLSPPQLQPPAFKYTGWAWFTMGRVISSPYQLNNYDVKFEDEWLIDFDAGFKFTANMPHNWVSRFHLGMSTAYPVLDHSKSNAEFERRKLAFYMIDAAMEKTIKSGDQTFYVEGGFFPIKYNPQAMNLGEYLFRSGTYPQYLNSGFELADKEKLTGVHFSYKNLIGEQGFFKADAFITSGMRDYPIHDISPAVLLAYSPHSCFEIGVGGEYSHLIAVDERKTTPSQDKVLFQPGSQEYNIVAWIDTAKIDTSKGEKHDTTKYTFRGIKTIARLSFNPGTFLSGFRKNAGKMFFGKEDLKIYTELAILGVQNYPGWYKNLDERIPIMFGFNCPTFQPFAYTLIPAILAYNLTQGSQNFINQRTLTYGIGGAIIGAGFMLLDRFLNIDTKADVLALEGEFFNYKYVNSADNVWRSRSPVPYTGQKIPFYTDRGTNWQETMDDNWKWSVYLSKKLLDCLRVSAQVASDHQQRSPYMFPPPQSSNYTELVPRSKDWYWMTRIMYYF